MGIPWVSAVREIKFQTATGDENSLSNYPQWRKKHERFTSVSGEMNMIIPVIKWAGSPQDRRKEKA